jgi:hypothetical protein
MKARAYFQPDIPDNCPKKCSQKMPDMPLQWQASIEGCITN